MLQHPIVHEGSRSACDEGRVVCHTNTCEDLEGVDPMLEHEEASQDADHELDREVRHQQQKNPIKLLVRCIADMRIVCRPQSAENDQFQSVGEDTEHFNRFTDHQCSKDEVLPALWRWRAKVLPLPVQAPHVITVLDGIEGQELAELQKAVGVR